MPAVRRLVDALGQQTARARMELIFVFPRSAPVALDPERVAGFERSEVVRVDDMHSTSVARAAGIRAARAPVVALTEDHSLPEPGWAEALIEAHRGDWAAVGPAVRNGNANSLLSWVNLVIEYVDWLYPAPGGEAEHLPGHNSSYKRAELNAYGDELASWLDAESVLHWDLRARGRRLALEPRAVTRHYNFSRFGPTLKLRYNAGRQFAGMCRLRWSLARRWLYFCGSPLIPFVRGWRIFRKMRRTGRPAHLLPRLLPACFFMLTIETVGQAIGFLFGPGDTGRYIAAIDFHREEYMNARDRAEFTG